MTSSLYSRDSRTKKICSRLMNEWEEYYVSVIIPLFRFQCLFRVSVISCSSETFIWYLTDFGRSIPLLMRERLKGIINNQTKGCSWFPWNLLGVLLLNVFLPPASLSTQSLVPDIQRRMKTDWKNAAWNPFNVHSAVESFPCHCHDLVVVASIHETNLKMATKDEEREEQEPVKTATTCVFLMEWWLLLMLLFESLGSDKN